MTLVQDIPNVDTAVHERPVALSMKRGFFERCPKCGEGKIYYAYLKVNDECPVCHEELHHQRADDAPPYVTIVIVGHILVTLYVLAEDYGPALPAWAQVAIFCTLGLVMCLMLLPRVKGALIGLQWALRMHGFHGPEVKTSGSRTA